MVTVTPASRELLRKPIRPHTVTARNTAALDRVIQVVLGIVVALAVTILIFPRHAGDSAPEVRKGDPIPVEDRESDSTE